MSAMSEDVGLRRDIEAGKVVGPHLVLAAMIDGQPPIWPVGMSRVATTPEAGRQTVRDMKADGFDLIKVYSVLDYATFQAIADEAHKLHMKVVGHIPGRNQGQTERWLTDGLDMVAHARGVRLPDADGSPRRRRGSRPMWPWPRLMASVWRRR